MSDEEHKEPRGVLVVMLRHPRTVLETMAIAWVQIQIIKEHLDRPDTGLNLLRGCWEEVGKVIRREPGANMVAVQVLQEYFTHSGDWDAMQVCLAKNAQRHQVGGQSWDDLLSKMVPMARAEYVEVYGQS